MRIEVTSTDEFFSAGGTTVRAWKGRNLDTKEEVVALICGVRVVSDKMDDLVPIPDPAEVANWSHGVRDGMSKLWSIASRLSDKDMDHILLLASTQLHRPGRGV